MKKNDSITGMSHSSYTSFTREFKGIGLGLSITRQMLDAIGARIWVASIKEVGTTFMIEFSTGQLKV